MAVKKRLDSTTRPINKKKSIISMIPFLLVYIPCLSCIPIGSQSTIEYRPRLLMPLSSPYPNTTNHMTQSTSVINISRSNHPRILAKRSQPSHNCSEQSPKLKSGPRTGRLPAKIPLTVSHRVGGARQFNSNSSMSLESNSSLNNKERQKSAPIGKADFYHLFREEAENYPEDEIRSILKNTSEELKSLYNVLDTPLDPNMNLSERTAYHGDDDSNEQREESVCRYVTRNIYPREATRENAQVYIPNNQEFMQVIQAEICQNPDRECSYLQDNLPYEMISSCRQKYAYKKLLYLDPLEKRMATDLFRYPSCCSCYVRHSPIDSRTSRLNSSRLSTPSSQQQHNSPSVSISSITNPTSERLPSASFKDAAGTIYNDPVDLSSMTDEPSNNSLLATTNNSNKLLNDGPILDDVGVNKETTTQLNSGIPNKRRPKALNLSTVSTPTNVIRETTAPVNNTGPSQRKRLNSDAKPVSNGSNSRLAKKIDQTNSTQTVVLHEDKVYTPDN